MSQSVDSLWKSVVKQLQQLPAKGPEQQWDAFSTINRDIDALSNKTTLPRATWKHLIRDLKVPLQPGTICCSLDLNSSSSSSSRASAVYVATWSWNALVVFLSAAAKKLIPVTDDPVAAQRASSTSLPSAIAPQLQQSGLLQQFPSTLLAAAQLLKDATTTAGASGYRLGDDTRPPAGSTHGQAAAAAAAVSSSRGSIGGGSFAYDNLLLLSEQLASAVHVLGCFQPQHELVPEAARRLDAAACFCLAVMQLVTAALDSVLAESTAPVMLGNIYRLPLCLAVTGLLHVMEAVQFSLAGRTSLGRRTQLLESSNIRAAVRVLACTWYARTLMPSTSGRLSSDSIAAATAGAAAAAATAQRQGQFNWQAAAMLCTPLDPPQQQQQQQQQHFEPCLAATGVSLHAAAWAAAGMDSAQVSKLAVTIVSSTSVLVRWCARQHDTNKQQPLLQLQPMQQLESFGSAVLLVAQQALRNLQLLQLLMCSIEQQPSLLGPDFEYCAAEVAQASFATAFRLPECYMAAAVTRFHQQQQPSSSFVPAVMAGPAAAAQHAQTQATELLYGWSACMLPTVLALLQQAQQRVRARHTADAAAASSCGSGISSSSSSQLSQAQSPTEDAIMPLVGLLTAVAQNVAAARPCEGALLVKLPPVSWAKHCTPLCVALDGCLRLQAGSSGALENSTHACSLVESVVGALLKQSEGPVAAAAVLAGPGSAEQRQLFSMLVSLLKVCGALSADAGVGAFFLGGWSPQQAAEGGPVCAALTAACCLSRPLPDTHSSTGEMAACDASGSPAAAAAAAAGSAGQKEAAAAATAATPTDSLPALVICGRCCLQWAGQLQVLQQQNPDLGERLLLLKQVNSDRPEGAAKLLQVQSKHAAVALFAGPQASAAGVLRTCRDWLSQGDTTKALAAAGYPAEAILQKLGVLLELLGQPAAAPDAAAAVAAYDQVVQQLQAVGLAFNTLAFPDACNNPFCSNMSGATELESVSGRANMCGGCLVARYCSKACQASHWKQHKPVCKALRAAAVSDTAKAD